MEFTPVSSLGVFASEQLLSMTAAKCSVCRNCGGEEAGHGLSCDRRVCESASHKNYPAHAIYARYSTPLNLSRKQERHLRTLLPIFMFVVSHTKPSTSPRLAPTHILPKHHSIPTTLPHTPTAESTITAHALIMTDARLEHLSTAFAAFCRIPTARPPGHK